MLEDGASNELGIFSQRYMGLEYVDEIVGQNFYCTSKGNAKLLNGSKDAEVGVHHK